MDVACYRLQSIRSTLSRVAILASTHQQPLWNFHAPSRLLVTFELAAVTLTRGLARQKVSRNLSFCCQIFSHLESVTEPKKVGSKVWCVGGSGSKHPLNAVALWQSAQFHHLLSEEKIQRGYRLEHE